MRSQPSVLTGASDSNDPDLYYSRSNCYEIAIPNGDENENRLIVGKYNEIAIWIQNREKKFASGEWMGG